MIVLQIAPFALQALMHLLVLQHVLFVWLEITHILSLAHALYASLALTALHLPRSYLALLATTAPQAVLFQCHAKQEHTLLVQGLTQWLIAQLVCLEHSLLMLALQATVAPHVQQGPFLLDQESRQWLTALHVLQGHTLLVQGLTQWLIAQLV